MEEVIQTMPKASHATFWMPALGRDGGPVYLAIAEAVAADIASGRLQPGMRLPPQRALAEALGIDFTTVTRAYAEAGKRGLVEGRVGHGTYVRLRQKQAAPALGRAVDIGMNLPPHFEDAALAARMQAGIEEVAGEGLGLLLAYQDPRGAQADCAAGAQWLRPRLPDVTAERIAVCPGTQGALVADITGGGPAQKAGLQKGDVVINFDNRPIGDSRELPRVVAATPIGKTVNIDVLRRSKKQSYRIVIAKLDESAPDKPGKKLPPPTDSKSKSKLSQLGLTVVGLDENARAKYKLAGNVQGVVVSAVDPASPAADKNFRPGDVIVEVQSQPVKAPADVEARVDADAKAGKKVELMLVNRNGDLTYVALRLD
jgi:DNA-binding transcriptional regulator YhcF (GntR family)